MKKLSLTLALALGLFIAYGQTYKQGDLHLLVGFAGGMEKSVYDQLSIDENTVPLQLNLGVEIASHHKVGILFRYGTSLKGNQLNDSVVTSYNELSAGLSFHYFNTDKINVYSNLSVGTSSVKVKYSNQNKSTFLDGIGSSYQINTGCFFYPHEKVGFYGELSYVRNNLFQFSLHQGEEPLAAMPPEHTIDNSALLFRIGVVYNPW